MACKDFWPLNVTAWALVKILGEELYKDKGDCLWEIVKNGLNACMKSDKWDPKQARVEIRLLDSHPLGGSTGKTLMILDYGCGFTEAAMARYSTIGPSKEDRKRRPKGEFHGAAQKRVGRFATFAENEKLAVEEDFSTGFYILTRTAEEGPVTFVEMIPDKLEEQKGIRSTQIQVWAKEMGPIKNIKGSFTAVVIPYSVYTSAQDIREALMWKIPRKPELMFDLRINGEPLAPPKLINSARSIHSAKQDGRVEVHIERARTEEEGGIWITDLETGFRCAFCPGLGPSRLPDPLYRYELRGDIFVEGVLENQDTSRSTLNQRFLKSAAWRSMTGFLLGSVVGEAKALLGKEFTSDGHDDLSKTLDEIKDWCVAAYGRPDPKQGPGDWSGPGTGRQPGTGSHGGGKGGGTKGGGGGGTNGGGPGRLRMVTLPINGTTYIVSRRSLGSSVLAEVDPNNGTVIWLNDKGYLSLPSTKESRREHTVMMLLHAVGSHLHPADPRAVAIFAADRRRELLQARSTK